MPSYVKTTQAQTDPGTSRHLPAGYVGQVTGGGTGRLAVGGTQYPAHWFEPATEDEYQAYREATRGLPRQWFDPPLVGVNPDGTEVPIAGHRLDGDTLVPV